ncbi:MAG: SET domain-containing protein-lysine N-methyltransferase [Ignavibacteria bacterium]
MYRIHKDKELKKKIKTYTNFVEVRDSGIHGFGIFASGEIPENGLILIIEGEVISPEESIRRETDENNVYIFWNGSVCIDTILSDKIKYINHSCEPSCRILGRSKKSLRLVANRDILTGEEFTIDYAYKEIYEYCNCEKCGYTDNHHKFNSLSQ